MDEKLKQRVVGATVLVALGVIFIPMLLTGEPPAGITKSNIPPKPGIRSPEPATPAPPRRPVPVRSATPVAPEPLPTPAPEAKPAPPETVAAPAAAPRDGMESWVIQLGSFGAEQNAIAVRDKLRAGKFPAFVESAEDQGERVYRVRVGPELDRSRAEAKLKEIKRKLALDGIVMRYR